MSDENNKRKVELNELSFPKVSGGIAQFVLLSGKGGDGEKRYLSRQLAGVGTKQAYQLAVGQLQARGPERAFSQTLDCLDVKLMETAWDGKEGTLKFDDGREEKANFSLSVLSKIAGGGKFVSDEGATSTLREMKERVRKKYEAFLSDSEKIEKFVAKFGQGIEFAMTVRLDDAVRAKKPELLVIDETNYQPVELERGGLTETDENFNIIESVSGFPRVLKETIGGHKIMALTFKAGRETKILKKGTYTVGLPSRSSSTYEDIAELAAKGKPLEVGAANDFATLAYRMVKKRGVRITSAYIDVMPVVADESQDGNSMYGVAAVGGAVQFEYKCKEFTIGERADAEKIAKEGAAGNPSDYAVRIAYAAAMDGAQVEFRMRKVGPDSGQMLVVKPNKVEFDPSVA